jgi:DNA-binding PadR family transcriptional regulator
MFGNHQGRASGGHRGGGRIFRPGDLRLVLLALIDDKPRHGYELIKALEEEFGGNYAPSPGSVYPTLTLLEELGYLRATETEGKRRLYEATAEGRQHLAEQRTVVDATLERMAMAARAMSGDAPPEDVHEAMHTLKAALRFHRGEWSAVEVKRVSDIINGAARAISGESDNG